MKSKREQRHASIVFQGGNPLAFGFNTSGLHAEEHVIKVAFCLNYKIKGATMVNIRLTRAGKIALAKPCPACYELLKEKKFRKIIYSDNNGKFVEEYL